MTGAAGFIGFHTCRRLASDGVRVVGIDNLNDYYDPALKHARRRRLGGDVDFRVVDIRDREALHRLFDEVEPDVVINLAAQAGVRYSLENPYAYVDTNLAGFSHVLELARRHDVRHLVYASSSSVYGANSRLPFSPHDGADHPVSLYAATKRANELMAHAYSHLYRLPTTGLRFFTVYGPWGRPDMAYYRFAEAILDDEPITVFGDGSALRDFTFVDDIVDGVVRVARRPAEPDPTWTAQEADPASSDAPYRILNIGHGQQVSVTELIEQLEHLLGRRARKVFTDPQPGDLRATHADVADLDAYVGTHVQTDFGEGVKQFVEWFLSYRGSL